MERNSWRITSILLHAPNIRIRVHNVSRSRCHVTLFSIPSKRRKAQLRLLYEVFAHISASIRQFSSSFLVNCYKIVLVTSFLFSEPLPVLIRVSRAFSSVFRSIAHANESGDKSDVITAGISNGVHETASRSSREQECDTVHVCRPMRVESDDGLNKQSRTRVSREIHSFVWYPPRTSPPTPRLHFPCSLSSPFLASVHRVHLIFMSPYI